MAFRCFSSNDDCLLNAASASRLSFPLQPLDYRWFRHPIFLLPSLSLSLSLVKPQVSRRRDEREAGAGADSGSRGVAAPQSVDALTPDKQAGAVRSPDPRPDPTSRSSDALTTTDAAVQWRDRLREASASLTDIWTAFPTVVDVDGRPKSPSSGRRRRR